MDSEDAMGELIQYFVDQTAFMQYLKAYWVPKIEMWLATTKGFSLASQEASGAIETYHVKLKLKLYDDSHLGVLQRVGKLVHKLTNELHSSYWLHRYADESDSFQNKILDAAVTLGDKEHLFAKVVSQKDKFSFCDCEWSMQGNLCDCEWSIQRDLAQFVEKNTIDDSIALDQSIAGQLANQHHLLAICARNSSKNAATLKKNRERKRLSQFR
uniref:Uncharacterized protein n=1 Tax=Nelumbo nucifera TaxID=4432 RepID=A0A822XUA1_NELNU|nr:TPA_asm: hypothetical protein HUJ06_024142 [Nelumbo nucifera]